MKKVKWSGRLFAVIALGMIANAAFTQPAQAYWDRYHRWHDRYWHRPCCAYEPGVVYSPPPVVYTPPPASPGINLVVPLNFR